MISTIMSLVTGKPILVIFDVTKLCNERCPMCNIWKEKSNDMSLEEIKCKAIQLHNFGIKYVFIQGGEPTLRRDLIDIVDIFIEHKIKPTIITNGILLNYGLAKEISQRRCNLAISIDSLNEDRFKLLRGVNALDKIKKNIEEIKRIKRKGNWSITTTVSSLSEESDIFKIEDYALQNGFMHAIRPYIYTIGNAGKKVDEMTRDKNKVIKIFERYIQTAKSRNYLAYLIYLEHLKYLKNTKMPICDAMKYSILMKENGDFSPCIEFPNISISLENYKKEYKCHYQTLYKCNLNSPCFYNDAREIGIIWRNKLKILLHLPQISMQLIRYGNFF